MCAIKRAVLFLVITLVLSSAGLAVTVTSPFLNYPNPFKTREAKTGTGTTEGTYFAYTLSEAANIELRIYMMDGSLIWKRSYSSSDTEGTAGYHEVFWNGHPDTGMITGTGTRQTMETVPNGILLSFLLSNGKVIAKNKITVFQ